MAEPARLTERQAIFAEAVCALSESISSDMSIAEMTDALKSCFDFGFDFLQVQFAMTLRALEAAEEQKKASRTDG